MLTKCLKCGTTMEYDQHKCPSCGVKYFDMSCIQFNKDSFVYLKLNINPNGEPLNVIIPVKPRLDDIEINFNNSECYDRFGNVTYGRSTDSQIKAKISFEGCTTACMSETLSDILDESEG